MNGSEAAVLGLVQGLTEFLPISSSAHLRIVAALAGWDDPGAAFTAVTQLGTGTAVALHLRADIARIGRAWLRSLTDPGRRGDPDARTGWLIALGTLPIGLVGYALRDVIEGPLRDLRLTAGALIGVGALLAAADGLAADGRAAGPGPAPAERPAATPGSAASRGPFPRRGLGDLSARHGLLLGLAQAAALVPGVSRSGATISAGLFLGYSRDAAARYSFLLALPAVLASGLFELARARSGSRPDADTVPIGPDAAPIGPDTVPIGPDTVPIGSHTAPIGWGPTVGATATAFVVGYAAVAWFLRHVSARGLGPFVAYRIGLGLLLLALMIGGTLDAVPGPA